jgi:hypothetical protein
MLRENLMNRASRTVTLLFLLGGFFAVGALPVNAQSISREKPQPTLAPGGEVSAKFIDRLAEKNPLLAGAVRGSITDVEGPRNEILGLRLVPGEHTGTMGRNGRSYTFKTLVKQEAEDVFSLAVHVEEDRTGRAEDFEGVILDKGQSGRM